MNVITVFQGTYPNGGPMAKRLHFYCKALKEYNHEVTVVIPHASEHYNNINKASAVKGVYDGIFFEYLSNTKIRSKFFFKRRVDDFIGYIKLFIFLLNVNKKIDIIFVVDVRNVARIIICIISYIKGAKVLYELNEHPLVLFKQFQYAFDKFFVYPLFDGFVVISKPLFHLVNTFKSNKAKLLVVPILTDYIEFDVKEKCTLELNEPYILHSGSLIERKDGVLGIIKAFAEVKRRTSQTINLYFTGNVLQSPNYIEIISLIEFYNLNNSIKFLGYLNENELRYCQKNSLLFIINKYDNFQNKFCFPTKLGEYLMTSRPVIITDIGDLREYFINNYNAYIVKPEDTSQIADRILYILSNPELSNLVGIEGKRVADSYFNYKKQASKINNFFVELVC